jgi:hypothetical protein
MIRVLFIFIFLGFYALGCDVCNIFEYANRTNQSYIGLFYRNRFFNGYDYINHSNQYFAYHSINENEVSRIEHNPDFGSQTFVDKTIKDTQKFHALELRFNYSFKAKWNFQLIAPFLWNQIYYAQVITFPRQAIDSTLKNSGIGDPLITVERIFTVYTGMTKHILKPGLGVKFPLGSTTATLNNKIYDYELQSGTGSTDFIFRFSYLVTNDKWGADAFINYRINTLGRNDIHLGDRFNAMTNIFYTIGSKKIKVLPKIGAYFEWGERDKNVQQTLLSTGGKTLFAQFGTDIMLDKIIIQLLFQLPVYEKLNGKVIGNAGRLNIGLIYNF